MGWRTGNGKLKEMSCRKALNKLHKISLINLPEPKETPNFNKIDSYEDFQPEISNVEDSISFH